MGHQVTAMHYATQLQQMNMQGGGGAPYMNMRFAVK